MSWEVELDSEATLEDIEGIFEWASLDCAVTVEDRTPPEETAPPAPAADATATAEPAKAEAADKPAAKKQPEKGGQKANAESQTIRIATEKIDQIMNMVGELVITQSMLRRITSEPTVEDYEQLSEQFAQQERNIRELMDPLVHLVRNSLDHGLGSPEDRKEAGKDPTGTLTLEARHQGGNVVISIGDDGKGINRTVVKDKALERGIISPSDELTDEQIDMLIFAPGFSTAAAVSDVSGRGVGMDVVKRNIADLGGHVTIASNPGEGTTVTIHLPLTLAILDGQLVRVADQIYVLPILSIVETLELSDEEIKRLPGGEEVVKFRGDYLPLVNLQKKFNLPPTTTHKNKLVVIVESLGEMLGLVIDHVVGQQQVVIKALEENYHSVSGFAGATIMNDGSVALILDPPALSQNAVMSEAA